MALLVLKRLDNIQEKAKNVGYHHYHLFPQYFQSLRLVGKEYENHKVANQGPGYEPFPKYQNFGHNQIESTCSRQIECCENDDLSL